MKNMTSNKKSITETILKTAVIIALAAIIGFSFTACKDDEEEGDDFNWPTAGDGFLGLTYTENFPVVGFSSTTFTNFSGNKTGLLTDINSTAVITSNELKVNLGAISDESKLFSASEYWEGPYSPSDLKLVEIQSFRDNDGSNRIYWEWVNGTNTEWENSFFVYANKDGKISFEISETEDGWTIKGKVDVILKKGWNTVIQYTYEDESNMTYRYAYVSGKPGSNIKWVSN